MDILTLIVIGIFVLIILAIIIYFVIKNRPDYSDEDLVGFIQQEDDDTDMRF